LPRDTGLLLPRHTRLLLSGYARLLLSGYPGLLLARYACLLACLLLTGPNLMALAVLRKHRTGSGLGLRRCYTHARLLYGASRLGLQIRSCLHLKSAAAGRFSRLVLGRQTCLAKGEAETKCCDRARCK